MSRALRVLAPAAALAIAWGCGGEPPAGGEGSAEDAGDALAGMPPGAAVAATVTFPRPVGDSAAVAFLQERSLHPFAVHLSVEGLTGVHREDRADASLEVVGRARQEAGAVLTNAVCAQQGRAWALLQGEAPPASADLAPLRRLLADLARLDAALEALGREAPAIRAVEVVGTPADLRAARDDSRAEDVVPAEDPSSSPPPPSAPAPAADSLPPDVAALSRESLLARARELAARGLEDCHDYPRPGSGPR